MKPAYVLEIDGASKSALQYPTEENIGKRYQVKVYNESDLSDVKSVEAWWSKGPHGLTFNYQDGNSNRVVQFGPEMAKVLLS